MQARNSLISNRNIFPNQLFYWFVWSLLYQNIVYLLDSGSFIQFLWTHKRFVLLKLIIYEQLFESEPSWLWSKFFWHNLRNLLKEVIISKLFPILFRLFSHFYGIIYARILFDHVFSGLYDCLLDEGASEIKVIGDNFCNYSLDLIFVVKSLS